jgi:hypothetical protein
MYICSLPALLMGESSSVSRHYAGEARQSLLAACWMLVETRAAAAAVEEIESDSYGSAIAPTDTAVSSCSSTATTTAGPSWAA